MGSRSHWAGRAVAIAAIAEHFFIKKLTETVVSNKSQKLLQHVLIYFLIAFFRSKFISPCYVGKISLPGPAVAQLLLTYALLLSNVCRPSFKSIIMVRIKLDCIVIY